MYDIPRRIYTDGPIGPQGRGADFHWLFDRQRIDDGRGRNSVLEVETAHEGPTNLSTTTGLPARVDNQTVRQGTDILDEADSDSPA